MQIFKRCRGGYHEIPLLLHCGAQEEHWRHDAIAVASPPCSLDAGPPHCRAWIRTPGPALSPPPSFLSFPRNPNPSSPRFRPPQSALNRRRPGTRRARLACPTAPPRRHRHPLTRNWRGKSGFVASIRVSASLSAAAVVMAAVVPANPEPSRAHLRHRRIPLSLLTVEFEPGWPGIDGIIRDVLCLRRCSPG